MTDTTDPRPTTRDRIKSVAQDLYVLKGYDGFSFADIATAIGTTRANIHHHFGTKQALVEELVEGFVDNATQRIATHWGGTGIAASLSLQLDDLRRFYRRYNPNPDDRNVWSPLSRLRLDLPALGPLAQRALERADRFYDTTITASVQAAIAAGELRPETPVADVARILRVTILSCAPMTQDTGSFDELENLFGALERTLLRAWG